MLAFMKTLRLEFARRLAEIAENRGFRAHGRQAEAARICKVTQPAAKKWFDGDALPGMDHCITLAEWGGVCFEWLMTGRGPKYPGDPYHSPAIAHVVAMMQTMEEPQQYLVSRITDEIAGAHRPASATTSGGGEPENTSPNKAASARL